jgi:hypothetical protein
MAKAFVITMWDGLEQTGRWAVPSNLSDAELSRMMERLVCSTLTPEEIIDSSRRRNDPKRRTLLEPIGIERKQYGESPWFSVEPSSSI